jgi:hypothetical protein
MLSDKVLPNSSIYLLNYLAILAFFTIYLFPAAEILHLYTLCSVLNLAVINIPIFFVNREILLSIFNMLMLVFAPSYGNLTWM